MPTAPEGVEWWGTDCTRCGNAMPGETRCDTCGRTDQMSDLFTGVTAAPLTDDEHWAIELTGELASLLRRIIGEGPMAIPDWEEMTAAIHVIQRAVGAQAAARLWPSKYRLLGEYIEGSPHA